MGGDARSIFGAPLTKNEIDAMKAQGYPFISSDEWIRQVSCPDCGPQIRKLKKWSKQTEYGGEC